MRWSGRRARYGDYGIQTEVRFRDCSDSSAQAGRILLHPVDWRKELHRRDLPVPEFVVSPEPTQYTNPKHALFLHVQTPTNLSLSFFTGPEHSNTSGGGIVPLRNWSPAAGASIGWQGSYTSLAASYSHRTTEGGGSGGSGPIQQCGCFGALAIGEDLYRGVGSELFHQQRREFVLGRHRRPYGFRWPVSRTHRWDKIYGLSLGIPGCTRVTSTSSFSPIFQIGTTSGCLFPINFKGPWEGSYVGRFRGEAGAECRPAALPRHRAPANLALFDSVVRSVGSQFGGPVGFCLQSIAPGTLILIEQPTVPSQYVVPNMTENLQVTAAEHHPADSQPDPAHAHHRKPKSLSRGP